MDERLHVNVHPVYGGTAIAAQASVLQDAMAERFIVIQYGMNDSNYKSPIEPAFRSMLDRVKAMGRTPVLTGISTATAGEVMLRAVYNVTIANLAKEYGALYANWPGDVAYDAGSLMADGVHPTDDYQQRLADKLSATILAAAPGCAEAQ
ncbi:GDSL-type esterase/lipase family protein [Variovorax sp. YR216]|uniref:SGNH/GDSL hydrolase family protein n=1 Tax=Variovorax sp. YR216 TaxID=1882828 RepID=UPI0015A2FD98|nr:GDSL-type esterase/lipase family protein [Variovorax sp. YR216]